MYVNAFIVNVNKCLKPFFLEQHINIVNTAMLQIFWFSVVVVLILLLEVVLVVVLVVISVAAQTGMSMT